MKKLILSLMLPLFFFFSCSKEGAAPMQSSTETISGTGETVEGMMVLGRHLENPYSVENVRKAFCELYPTKSPRMIVATNLYVRFLPSDERELAVLDSIGVDTFDFPLDYEISRDGDFYHDPSLPQDRITWQYAVVPKSFNFPEGIEYEILDDCCFAEVESLLRSGSDVDWDEVERRSFELTGNAGLLEPESRASAKATPKGKITIYDNGSGEQVGVEGVKVLVNTLLKYSSAYTDKYGNYQISTRFSSKPHYRLRFHNQTGFSIGLNLILVQASTSSLGTGPASGLDVKITSSSDATLFRRCAVNNAAYDYYAMCQKDGITAPASNIRFWIMNILKPSCTLMMHHGAILNESLVSNYLGVYGFILKIFSPDIVIGSKGQNWNYSELYLETMHEMAHATHYTRVGNEYWNAFVKYVLFSYVSTGSSYGTGNAEGAGYCEVGEMWAYYMENVVYKDRYDRALNAGLSYWFHPAILEKVEDAGVSRSQICLSLGQDVIDSPSFKSSLQTICPSKKSQIASAFAAYGL